MSRIALVFPGRGSYTEANLGSLSAGDERVQAAERLRRELGLEPLLELDGAPRFQPGRHLRPANASPLIYLVSLRDAAAAAAEHEVVAAAGNSLGWYTALAAAGALPAEQGLRLVQEVSLLQEELPEGGQLLYPLVEGDWRADEKRERRVRDLLAALPADLFLSIRLGGIAVLAGSEAGVERALNELPPVRLGRTDYPCRLAWHGPYHTPLVGAVAERARARLEDLRFSSPRIPLVDGRGVRWSPWCSDPDALKAYTLGPQLTSTFDFTAALRVLLLEHAPLHLVLPGPGNTLGGIAGQVLVQLGWRGIHSRADFERAQAGGEPVVVSLGR